MIFDTTGFMQTKLVDNSSHMDDGIRQTVSPFCYDFRLLTFYHDFHAMLVACIHLKFRKAHNFAPTSIKFRLVDISASGNVEVLVLPTASLPELWGRRPMVILVHIGDSRSGHWVPVFRRALQVY